MFEPTPLNAHNQRVQGLVRWLFLGMTILLIVPVLLILGVLIYSSIRFRQGWRSSTQLWRCHRVSRRIRIAQITAMAGCVCFIRLTPIRLCGKMTT